MNKKLLSVAVVSATVASQAVPFIAAEPVVELKDSPVIRKMSNPGVAPIGTVEAGTAPVVKQGTQKVLCVMVNINQHPFQAAHNEQFYSDSLFGSAPDSVKNFISNQSGGRVVVEPADTKDSAVKGVIKVDVDGTKYSNGTIGASEYDLQRQITLDVLEQIKDRVDWAKIDQDGNKTFEESFLTDNPALKEELLVVTVLSGAAESTTTKVEGQIKAWPHLTELTTQLGEYKFLNSAIIASEQAGNNALNKTVLSHEYLHNLNARDMYLDTNSIGPWSAMCDTYGKRPGTQTTSPTPLDPVHKIYMGWSQAKPVTRGEQDVEIPFNKEEVPYIQHPTDPDVVYLLDYRDFSDENVKALHKFGVEGDGMVVWKINKTEAQRDWLKGTGDQNDWYINSKGPRTAMGVLAANNGDANVTNSFMPVNTICTLDGTDLQVAIKDKKMILKGTATTPEPPPVEEKLTIEAVDKTMEAGQPFDPLAGIVVRDSKGEIVQAKLELVKSTVNPDKEGQYTVTVRATYNGATAEVTYKVTVNAKPPVVAPPVIHAENKVINKGDTFNAKEGVTATDGKGEDITASIKVVDMGVKTDVPGTYQVTYEVADSYGNKTTKTITVIVKDTAKPEPEPEPGPGEDGEQKPGGDEKPDGEGEQKPTPDPTKDSTPPKFEGVKDAVVTVGEKFNPLEGITAKDEKDGEVKVQVMPSEIDTAKPGKFVLTYYAFDKSGNMASYDRLVEVVKSQTAGDSTVADKVVPEFKLFDTEFSFPAGNRINPLGFVRASDDQDGDLTDKVKIVGEVPDLSKPGNHVVKVEVEDKSGNKKEAELKFNITNNKAAIYAPKTAVYVGEEFDPLKGVTAVSKSGAYLTDKIKVDVSEIDTAKPGSYVVTYKVKDYDGEEVSVKRDVIVEGDKNVKIEAPSIKFTQNAFTKVSASAKSASFDKMEGVTASTKDVTVTGEVNLNATGIYPLVYHVKGENGYDIEVVRKVVVVPQELTSSAPYVFMLDNRVEVGTEFKPKSAALVVDKEDGLLNSKLLVEKSDVDINKVGRYTVKFSVIDSEANATSHVANVNVVAKPLGDPTKPGEAKPSPDGDKDQKPGEDGGTNGNGNNTNGGTNNGGTGNGTSGNGGRFPQSMGNLPKTGTTVMGFGAAIGAFVSGVLRFGRKRH